MDDLAKVRGGMELLSWEYDDATWEKLITSRRAHLRISGAPGQELDRFHNPGHLQARELAEFLGVPLWKGV